MPDLDTLSLVPLAPDLAELLAGAGLTAPSVSERMDGFCASALAQFGRETGYTPFLAASATRYFDPPGYHSGPYAGRRGGERILRLDNGLVSVSALTIGGESKTVNEDFWLRPSNNPAGGKPYEWIEFYSPVFGTPNCISITGVWGYASTLPADAWHGILYLAAVMVTTEIKEGRLQGLISWKDGESAESRGEQNLQKLGENFQGQADKRISMFKRVVTWL